MAAQPVEWVLVVYYGPEAHRSTYGRQVRSKRYSKDFIQLSKKSEFLDAAAKLFGVNRGRTKTVPLTYRWLGGITTGDFVFESSDRSHLKWGTSSRAPQAWKMSLTPTDSTAETIPGDPSHLDFDKAENELALLASRGAGQPYLMAIKLRDEQRTLHLRAYLGKPTKKYKWADLQLTPPDVQLLAQKTRQTRAFAWSTFQSGGVLPGATVKNAISQMIANPTAVINELNADASRALVSYLRQPGFGLFFDPSRNHDAWQNPAPLSEQIAMSADEFVRTLDSRFPSRTDEDTTAEAMEVDLDEVEDFRNQIERNNFAVPDVTATVKTRGSAQKAFAERVKSNYGFQCAITGIGTRDFLVAAHIVPWSKDQSIRLDPANGICLSLMMDRAFEKGYLLIENDYTIRVNWNRVGKDNALQIQLKPYDGRKLRAPLKAKPKLEYLQRRQALADA